MRWLIVLGNILVPTVVVGLVGQALNASPTRVAVASLAVVAGLHVLVYREAIDRAVRPHRLLFAGVVSVFALVVAAPSLRRTPVVANWMLRHGLSGLATATGIVEYNPHANDFLPHLGKYIDGAREEVWFTGISFYITLPQYRDALAAKARSGVTVRFLVYDPLSPDLDNVAASFGQTREALLSECRLTVGHLHELTRELTANGAGGSLQVRLFRTIPRSRIYVFDRHREDGYTYFIPHVGNLNTPLLPGFLVRNVRTGIAPAYFDGVERAWNGAEPFETWWPRYAGANGAGASPDNPGTSSLPVEK